LLSKDKERDKPVWPAVDSGTSLSGLLGGIMVLGLIAIFGIGIKLIRKISEKR